MCARPYSLPLPCADSPSPLLAPESSGSDVDVGVGVDIGVADRVSLALPAFLRSGRIMKAHPAMFSSLDCPFSRTRTPVWPWGPGFSVGGVMATACLTAQGQEDGDARPSIESLASGTEHGRAEQNRGRTSNLPRCLEMRGEWTDACAPKPQGANSANRDECLTANGSLCPFPSSATVVVRVDDMIETSNTPARHRIVRCCLASCSFEIIWCLNNPSTLNVVRTSLRACLVEKVSLFSRHFFALISLVVFLI